MFPLDVMNIDFVFCWIDKSFCLCHTIVALVPNLYFIYSVISEEILLVAVRVVSSAKHVSRARFCVKWEIIYVDDKK